MQYAMTEICALCGLRFGDHSALKQGCPTRQAYVYSQTDFFTPKAALGPKFKKGDRVRILAHPNVPESLVGLEYTIDEYKPGVGGGFGVAYFLGGDAATDNCFELVSRPSPQFNVEVIGTFASQAVPEWRKMRDANLQPGHCPCGLMRAQCTYHGP